MHKSRKLTCLLCQFSVHETFIRVKAMSKLLCFYLWKNITEQEKDEKKYNHPELYDIQEGVVEARCGC